MPSRRGNLQIVVTHSRINQDSSAIPRPLTFKNINPDKVYESYNKVKCWFSLITLSNRISSGVPICISPVLSESI